MASNKMSRWGVEMLMELEGCKPDVYLDSGGLPTVGVGHLITDEEMEAGVIHGHSFGGGLTYEQCLDILAVDVERFEKTVNQFVWVPLNQNQFDALVSFCFNIGRRAFTNSTLVKVLNRRQYSEVPAQLRRWNKVNGKTIDGLKNRRAIEVNLFRLEPEPIVDWSPNPESGHSESGTVAQEQSYWEDDEGS